MNPKNRRPGVLASHGERGPECIDTDTLYLGVAGRLPGEQMSALLFHVSGCPRCARRLAHAQASHDEAIQAGVPASVISSWIPSPGDLTPEVEQWIDKVLASLLEDREPALVRAAAAKRGTAPSGPRVVCRGVDGKGKLRASLLRHVIVIAPTLEKDGGLSLFLRLDPSEKRYAKADAFVVVKFRPRGARRQRAATLRAMVVDGRLKISNQVPIPALSGTIDLVQIALRAHS